MADKKDKAQQDKQDVSRQGGNADEGEAHNSRFLHSSPEANVFSKGSSQADNSARSRGGDSAAGTPDEGRLGGSGGTSAPGTTGNDPDR
ncbi:hypothetical protein SRABI118_01564 [Massilia sp. Bi118]|uniref:hypothetical protein n=1 Tax=Massilia sp. Bi118 TaxID=2822346 RepID=UPI001DD0F923|nr:hypothetical protein [Massilia sp. Bi118]CAH0193769.1 hypothetical protein SRABI118_01564 [Massilia sp. Bi118]